MTGYYMEPRKESNLELIDIANTAHYRYIVSVSASLLLEITM